MSDLGGYLWLIPALPLLASIVTAALGPRLLREQSHWPCILACIGSFILSVPLLLASYREYHPAPYFTWFHAGDVDVGFTLRADPLTGIMLVTVTGIGSLIAIYSAGYMHGDPGYSRYFAEIALFIFSMTGLVLADNLLLLYAFWEGVGLCSYLLIGFWFTKPSAAAAARKAFLVTRIGDLGFILGIILLWAGLGHHLDYEDVFKNAEGHESLLTAACLLLFCGAVGKSAQFPLHVWLPDAMEGPSPVSALIHAATMVTAGVYMVARFMPLFRLVPHVLVVVAIIGAFTALLASFIALTQTDLKRVLAYSTISQLGYMFLALGSGVQNLAAAAVVAAIFHLFTHAFFKALLFLSAGSLMHAMGNVIDMRRFSGLRHVVPTTHWTFLCGALALSGFPPLAGFWSKDEILAVALGAARFEGVYAIYTLLFLSALLTAGLTAFYTFRAYFLTFWGPERIPPEAGEHAHESPPIMTIPLMILAVGAVGAGFLLWPFRSFILRTPRIGELAEPEINHAILLVASILVVAAGIGMAWLMYYRNPGMAGRWAAHLQALYQLSLNKLHLDEIYYVFVVAPLSGLAIVCRFLDLQVLDSIVDHLGQIPAFIGQLFRPIQNGLVQFYALAMALGLTVFLIALLRAFLG
ncbi:MAG TPA: NADH-quinone oxidoreductase subunit L [Gemmataceae bacterium]|jgi:NADH-quinone oxidoreductase subunit L|nr:NADH-quinone oxidoreductase subunit L [Gemmataceae bacterium]